MEEGKKEARIMRDRGGGGEGDIWMKEQVGVDGRGRWAGEREKKTRPVSVFRDGILTETIAV